MSVDIVQIKGLVRFTINLDPSVWIFDKRKIDLSTYLSGGQHIHVAEREVSGSYAISFLPFLQHADPLPTATTIICHRSDGERVKIKLEEAKSAVLGFAHEGKPIKKTGPLHLYLSHNSPAITHVYRFEVRA
jgi:hypothetical protein